MDVNPENTGTIKLEGAQGDVKEPTIYPTPYIDCFDRNEQVTITAFPKSGYQFNYWEFNYWPQDLNENIDKTSNPLSFINSYLVDGGYTDDWYAIRAITAHFTLSSSPPAPEDVIATDGTETGKVIIAWDSSPGTDDYIIYRASSLQGNKTQLDQTTETSFEDTTVTGENIYYYWIKAVNRYGTSPFSAPDSGYAYVDEQEPPPKLYEPEALTPAETRQMLNTDPDVIVLDVSESSEYKTNHIICAINGTLTVFGTLDDKIYRMIHDYKDFPVLVYDRDGSASKSAADYLADNGFSDVYYMTGGLLEWISNGWETVASDQLYECSLPPMALAIQDNDEVAEAQTVYLTGTGSEASAGDSLTAYEWKQYRGTKVDILNADSAEAIITSPNLKGNDEQLIFLLTVTDSQNVKDTDSVAVDVKWENDPPTADAGSPQSVTVGSMTILNGSKSEDTDDGIASYQWVKISGPELTLQDSTKESAWFYAPEIDTKTADLVFELTVTDHGGLTHKDQVSIKISRNNTPPTADAGENLTVPETQQVQLDGSSSHDADDGIATYAWTQIGGSPTVTLSSHSVASPTFTAPEVDETIILEFQLTVSDQSGAQSTDQVAITIEDVGDPPMADAGTDQNPVYEGWRVTLDGTESMDTDGEILSYQWAQTSGPDVSLTGENSATPEFTVPEIDEQNLQLVFQLTVTDDTGLTGTDQVKIVATKALMPPSADAGDDQEIKEGSPVILDSTGSSDPDDGIAQYSWQQTGGEPIVELSDSKAVNPEFTAPDIDKATVLTFTLTVTDYSGNEDTDEIEVRVLSKSGGGGGGSCFISTIR